MSTIIVHSAKGSTWKNHKYIAIKNGRYIYPKSVNANQVEYNKPQNFTTQSKIQYDISTALSKISKIPLDVYYGIKYNRGIFGRRSGSNINYNEAMQAASSLQLVGDESKSRKPLPRKKNVTGKAKDAYKRRDKVPVSYKTKGHRVGVPRATWETPGKNRKVSTKK